MTSRPFAWRATALAVLAAMAPGGCRSTPATPAPPSPVYEARYEDQPTYWRYVPLRADAAQHPSPSDFTRAQQTCKGTEFIDCLRGLGFYRAQCSDGVDNDGDGLVDHPSDPGCEETHALEEAPACDDDRDNDGDGLADWDGAGFTHADPECIDAPSRDRERSDAKRWFESLF